MKIGMSSDPEKRLKQLQTANSQKLQIRAKIKCKSRKHAMEVEAAAHEYFAKHHKRGEWFKCADIIIHKAWEFEEAMSNITQP